MITHYRVHTLEISDNSVVKEVKKMIKMWNLAHMSYERPIDDGGQYMEYMPAEPPYPINDDFAAY